MSTPSPTVFQAGYYGMIGFMVLGLIVLSLLCCSCIAKAQNDSRAFKLKRSILKKKYDDLLKSRNDPDAKYDEHQWQELLMQLQDLEASSQGCVPSISDALVGPITENELAQGTSLFFYHTGMGRFLLLSFEEMLNLVIGILSLVFTGMTISYINTYVLPVVLNPGRVSFNIIMFLGVFILVLTITRNQYRVFMRGRLGDTGVIEHLDQNAVTNVLYQRFSR